MFKQIEYSDSFGSSIPSFLLSVRWTKGSELQFVRIAYER